MNLSKEHVENVKELQEELITKSWNDSTFKAKLIANPNETIKEVANHKIKGLEDAKIMIDDQTDSNIVYLNIPRKINIADVELTDEQLEAVAGGEETSIFYDAGYWAFNNPGEAAAIALAPATFGLSLLFL